MKSLSGKIAVVAGATRGAGRGIACMLGEAGATVYCTGRSSRLGVVNPGRPETIEETAEMVTSYGGIGIPVKVDHSKEEEVKALFDRISTEQGKLDILVNDIWGGEKLTEWGKPFWELAMDKGFAMLQQAINTHVITSKYATPLMLSNRSGTIIEITDGDGYFYRGSFFYDLVKTSIIRIAFTMAHELKEHNISAIAVTPGFLRSEEMLAHFGVTEENWKEGAKKEPHFIASETPFYVGRGIAALVADPNVFLKTGRVFGSWSLVREYGFKDVDGNQPIWDEYVENNARAFRSKKCDEGFYSYWRYLREDE
ncbi:SDR family oxidoreductase [uncultured Chitinophaga sp.]|uniref:SDR family oxidoreductase n=1 Tax=uncultured Chitinophaga sp. TaxID=339340 RepID=UPI0025D93A09|nr:SDR family oxidoreductase [uncultured Chitinophaga sp.]